MAGITDLLSGLLGKSSKKKLIEQLSGLMGEGSPIGGLQGLLGKFEASGTHGTDQIVGRQRRQ